MISMNGVLPLSNSCDAVGTICKTVKDTKILFSILSKKKIKHELDLTRKTKIGFVHDFNFNQLDDYSKKKITLLNSRISKIRITYR